MLLRRTRGEEVSPPGRVGGAPAPLTFPSQCLAEFLKRLGRVDPHPAVLDLGVLCGDNIAFLGAKGCRVSVESLPNPGRPAAPARQPRKPGPEGDKKKPSPAPGPLLDYTEETFSGVLAWDAISRMPSSEATAFVETLRLLLLDGGVILAYFPGPTSHTAARSGRYRIMSESQLALEPLDRPDRPIKVFQNREIYSLFSRFEVVRMAQLKSGAREILVCKKTRKPARA